MKQAKVLKPLSGWSGSATLYEVSPPLEGHRFVVVSAAVAMFSGPETYIFPSDASGEVTDYGELDGSFSGALDHTEALRRVGYTITPATA